MPTIDAYANFERAQQTNKSYFIKYWQSNIKYALNLIDVQIIHMREGSLDYKSFLLYKTCMRFAFACVVINFVSFLFIHNPYVYRYGILVNHSTYIYENTVRYV